MRGLATNRGNKARGYFVETGPLGTVEHETYTCCHCNTVHVIAHRAAPEESGGFCMRCMAPTCKACAKLGRCTPFEKKLERYEKRQKMLTQICG